MSIYDPKHEHEVNDLDGYFIIDPITRSITNTTEAKTSLMQYDHNSEIFTFAIPRYVEDHDMTTSEAIQIHYVNSSDTEKQPGLYIVTDMRINDSGDEEMVTFSWVISQQAIALKGSLQFQIKFICYDSEGSGTPSYIWSTKVFSAINVLPGLNNAEVVVTEYPDILSQLSSELNRINDKINKLSVGGGGSGESVELNVQILDGVDLNSVHDTGIYKVWSNCDNLPDDFHEMEDPGVVTMIVTNDGGDGEYADAHQKLFAFGYDGESIVVQRIVQVNLKNPYEVYAYPWGAVSGGSSDLSNYYTKEETDNRFYLIESDMFLKQDVTNVVHMYDRTDYVFNFAYTDNYDYRLMYDNASSISFVFENGVYNDGYVSGISFVSGATPTRIDYTDSGILNWVGTDCSNVDGYSIFKPEANKHYDIVFYFNSRQFVGLVNGFVPSLGNVVA